MSNKSNQIYFSNAKSNILKRFMQCWGGEGSEEGEGGGEEAGGLGVRIVFVRT